MAIYKFKVDFEFVDGHQSHLGHLGSSDQERTEINKTSNISQLEDESNDFPTWTEDGQAELSKIPFFVRGKIKIKTEKYALQTGCQKINSETLYDAKAHFKA